MNFFSRLLHQDAPDEAPDGQAGTLEARALTAAAAEAEVEVGAAKGQGRRRQRELPSAESIMVEVVAEKVLHGWLQNRHQILYPLTMNLKAMEAGKVALLAQMLAIGLLSEADAQESRRDAAIAWFTELGGEPAHEAALSALAAPMPLDRLLSAVQEERLMAQAYVAALVSVNQHSPAGRLFLGYLAARLALPHKVVRSAERRYRR